MSKSPLPTRPIHLPTLSLLALLLATGCNPQDANPPKPTASKTSTSEPFDARLKNAESLLGQKKLEEAWAISKGLLVEQPKSVPALFLASQIMAARKNLPGAIELISQIDPSDPQAGPAATGQLSEWLAQSGDLPRAEAKLRSLLKEYPKAIPALRLLVDLLHAQGRRWDAGKVLERIVRLGDFKTPDLMSLVDLRDPKDQEPLRTAFEQFDPDDPMSQLGQVRLLLFADRWKDCIDRLDQWTKSHPQLLEPWIWYGESLLETGESKPSANGSKTNPKGTQDILNTGTSPAATGCSKPVPTRPLDASAKRSRWTVDT
jgi:predicted Zn-dependent protease